MICWLWCVVNTQQGYNLHKDKRVWFGTTTKEFLKYKEHYFAIRDYLIKAGAVIPFNWLEDAYDYKKNHPQGRRDIKGLFKKVLKAIDEADFSVIEYTVPNFSSSIIFSNNLLYSTIFKSESTTKSALSIQSIVVR